MNDITLYNFPLQVAWKTLNLLMERKALLHTSGVAFYIWKRGERLIVAFDPSAIDTARVNDDFAHRLSTRLHGRQVLRTNTRGLFLQVGMGIPAAPQSLEAMPLTLNEQKTHWHMPIGQTKNGQLWISLIEGDSFLIGGSRRKGKSGLTHGMIQALLHGGRTRVYAWDGKNGAEFGRYIGAQNFHFINNAEKGLNELSLVLAERLLKLRDSGYPNIILHNEAGKDFMEPVALFVDEIAELPDDLKLMLKSMVKLYGASGLYPILATNDPTQSSILVKTNLSTRICFTVPSFNDSLTVLGMKGAETLSARGRGLIVWDGELTEFQTFQVSYPMPSPAAMRLLLEGEKQAEAEREAEEAEEAPATDEKTIELAESIREKWHPDMSKRAVGRLLGKDYGGSWKERIDRVVAYLTATTTSTTPVLGLETA